MCTWFGSRPAREPRTYIELLTRTYKRTHTCTVAHAHTRTREYVRVRVHVRARAHITSPRVRNHAVRFVCENMTRARV